jgi:hypothetical protein
MSKTIGIVLIAAGAIALVWGGFSYTTKDTVIDAGPIQVTREKTHTLPVAPIAGAIVLVGGVVILAAGKKV